ncbi:acyl carrier protein [Ketogulonicigenium vulgare]|uniref:Carrier domain-containing protein n=1 Tax=Ketogulonicigenium vulgare (strain WSH-001) TaxID=759362 RepID=F9YA24_KETVW|nr:acyl carrier protein [Ketogulonicigenium vulgare]ADO43137.1 hypothetical protein EIO_2028 [Ketogulonicigenium vulgare Y25]AEM41435.1 hypothetical protein KVU_1596 [Ketogulonicigenium vulgare WSH-001]ALJ81568.1 hypothetical protein KVH_10515 [Ketogulonicigenium vulgare]ANW35124.1 hypothetical protein KvSKV_10440 [Ketogulonicigenium vulgare]AOZ55174.1 hypothetical protein KVC_2167 [Ketogulonicigenium vulgare]
MNGFTNTEARLIFLIAKDFHIAAEILPSTSLRGDLRMDSLDLVDLCVKAEDLFDIEINDAEATEATSIADLARLIDHVLAEEAAA